MTNHRVSRKAALLVTLPALGVCSAIVAMAQASNGYIIPYGMIAGMQVLNLATRPKPAAAPTPAGNSGGYGMPVGERRLVCEQWNGTQWVVIPVAAQRCNP
jgi:hypothetical protein